MPRIGSIFQGSEAADSGKVRLATMGETQLCAV
jgi:hypothetical protein